MEKRKKILASAMAAMIAGMPMVSSVIQAAGTTTIKVDGSTTDTSDSGYQNWKSNVWDQESIDSGKAILTPGATQNDLNIAWYSQSKGTPAVKISTSKDMSNAEIYKGTAVSIDKTNGINTYQASNKVSMNGAIQANTTYYYSYCDDIEHPSWSKTYSYTSAADFNQYSAILVGDPQIGASRNKDLDTYNWNKTITTATAMFPDVSFILSAGDQVDASGVNDSIKREQEYAGYLYPEALRSYLVATTVGNHESLGDDYRLHYNNPNADTGLGETTAGGDYYYTYGNTLYIILNTNNRNSAEHEQLMKQAVESDSDAKWKVVMFHHDIYGSASSHSDIDGANLRILFAPLMDQFDIDVCLTGHDHQYARTYQIIDGKVIDYESDGSSVTNPEGTMYITAGSASGSKYYSLNKTAQYYLAERVSNHTPSFSTINISDTSFAIHTYDYNGNAYAGTFTINKNADASASIQDLMNEAGAVDQLALTNGSKTRLNSATNKVKELLDTRDDSKAIHALSGEYDSTQTNNDPNKLLSYYAYANEGGKALAKGFSTLLDKTLYENNGNQAVAFKDLAAANTALQNALTQRITNKEVNAVKDDINEATALMNKAIEGKKKGQYQVGSKAELKSAIDTAWKELSKVDLTKDQLQKVSANIKEAMTAFQNAFVQEDVKSETTDEDTTTNDKKENETEIKQNKQETQPVTDTIIKDTAAPDTGDETNPLGYGAIMVISLAGIVVIGSVKLKEKLER